MPLPMIVPPEPPDGAKNSQVKRSCEPRYSLHPDHPDTFGSAAARGPSPVPHSFRPAITRADTTSSDDRKPRRSRTCRSSGHCPSSPRSRPGSPSEPPSSRPSPCPGEQAEATPRTAPAHPRGAANPQPFRRKPSFCAVVASCPNFRLPSWFRPLRSPDMFSTVSASTNPCCSCVSLASTFITTGRSSPKSDWARRSGACSRATAGSTWSRTRFSKSLRDHRGAVPVAGQS